MAYNLDELKAIAEVLLDFPNVVIATDDMYEHILWESKFCNILNACPDLYDRTMTLNGVSKAYSMTGWRIGYAGGPKLLIQAMKKSAITKHFQSNFHLPSSSRSSSTRRSNLRTNNG